MKYTYLLINLASAFIPFLFSFHPRIRFNRYFKYFIPANLIVAAFFIGWDVLFTGWGVWSFNPDYVTGINVINLPLEEVMFFICIPFACMFTYFSLTKLFIRDTPFYFESTVTPVLILFLLAIATIFIDHLYTSVTFIFLAGGLFYLKYLLKVKWLGGFYIAYSILLFPFFVVNGLLTGTGLPAPVVSYNDDENMGIRLLTIPFEDIFYGMLLVLGNAAFFNYFIKKRGKFFGSTG